MKTTILNLTAIALIATTSIFTGCKKDDTTAPIVTLTGAASQTISLQGTYMEQGATANDDKDGKLTPIASGTVNSNLTGTYTLTYSATDAAGNTGTATRTVIVQNDAYALAGTYTVTETCNSVASPTVVEVVSASTTVNNRIEFAKFANYAGNTSIYATLTGTTITLPSQTGVGIGTNNGGSCDVANHTFASTSGTTTSNGFTLTFTDLLAGPGSCSAAVVTCTENFTK